MPEPGTQQEPYAYVYSAEARETRKQFPSELVPKLLVILDELAMDPEAHPERIQKIGRRGEIQLYKHPDPPLEITYEIDKETRKLYFLHFAAPVVQLKQIFISYSHVDTEWFKRVKNVLQPLETQGLFRIWDDQKIAPGDKWLEEIEKALDAAQVAVLLVTQDFLQSPFILNKELVTLLSKAEKEGLRIIWIAVEKTPPDSPISQFQAANDPARPLCKLSEAEMNQVLEDIVIKLKKMALAN
ncbi:MAG TPA: toll/interleukin-1 receptor domain-containing protein [Candidatus Angelobacter sp.]|nr:toll/interleukin-1 receptor domain-containing protein [Candidatus Angelobacter sp.]